MKKDSLILLNLISKKRPDQHKLVGRLTVDLAEIANQIKYSTPEKYDLEYCSVNASIIFSAKLCGKKVSLKNPENFDRDSFSDYQSFLAHHPNLNNLSTRTRLKSHSIHDVSPEKYLDMPPERRSNNRSQNYVIEESQH